MSDLDAQELSFSIISDCPYWYGVGINNNVYSLGINNNSGERVLFG